MARVNGEGGRRKRGLEGASGSTCENASYIGTQAQSPPSISSKQLNFIPDYATPPKYHNYTIPNT
jgi:hypothetical protein